MVEAGVVVPQTVEALEVTASDAVVEVGIMERVEKAVALVASGVAVGTYDAKSNRS